MWENPLLSLHPFGDHADYDADDDGGHADDDHNYVDADHLDT